MTEATLAPATSLREALARAQGEFRAPRKTRPVTVRTKTGGTYSFSYAPLDEVLDAVGPALSKYGIARWQEVVMHDGRECVRTTISFGSEELSNYFPIIVSEEGAQKHASGVTYARRNGLNLLLCICAEEDDDGNLADGNDMRPIHGNAAPAGKAASATSTDQSRTPSPTGNGGRYTGPKGTPPLGSTNPKVKPLPEPPPPPAEVHDPQTGEITRGPDVIAFTGDWIDWGGRLVHEMIGEKDAAKATAWIDRNRARLDQCELEAPKIYARIITNIMQRLPNYKRPEPEFMAAQ